MSRNWGFRLRWTFFGLTDKYMEDVYEQFFALMYHGRWDFQQAYSLPVGLREWFVGRLIKQKEDEREATEAAAGGKSTYTLGPGSPPPRR